MNDVNHLNELKKYPRLGEELLAGVRETFSLACSLPQFFRERLTVKQAEEEVKKTLERREEKFLETARSRIYGNPESPYLKLLKTAGCEFADIQAQVRRDGLETMLEKLAGEGVYMTSDEFKGKKEVVRGSRSFRVSPVDFQRPGSAPGFVTQSSGTSNRPIRSMVPLDWQAVRAASLGAFFSAHDLFSHSHAVFDAILPCSAGIMHLNYHAKLGIVTERWFAREIPSDNRLAAWYHYLTTYLIVLSGKLCGPGFPRPEFTAIGDVSRIVRWIEEKNRLDRPSCVTTAASNAVRIARLAWEQGVSLHRTKFNVSGEPLTGAKRPVIERSGAGVTCRYNGGFSVDGGYGCADPLHDDEVHVSRHVTALISHKGNTAREGPPIPRFLFTSLHSLAPNLLLNVENGDYGVLETRQCGCALQKLGLTLHLHHIRSYEKFTSEGMNYYYGDLFELFEEQLPSEFGGGPGSYQLVEEEDENGQTRLSLLVHPEVGELDEAKLILRLQERLAQGSSANRFQAKIWQDAGTLRVRREVPHASPRGKMLPLHISR